MKKLLFGTVAAIGLSFAIAGGAFAANNLNTNKICSANDDFGLSNHGQCTAILNQCENTGNGPLCFCKFLRDQNLLEMYLGVSNIGQCVKIVGGPKNN